MRDGRVEPSSSVGRKAQNPPPYDLGSREAALLAGPSPSPILGELISEEVVSCQLDGLLRSDEGQVHCSSCGARGGGAQADQWSRREALSQPTGLPAGRVLPVTPWLPPPALSPTFVPGGGGNQAGQGSASFSRHCSPSPMVLPLQPGGPPWGTPPLGDRRGSQYQGTG